MKLSKSLQLLLPSVPYGNLTVQVAGEVDTDNATDLLLIGARTKDDAGKALTNFLEEELIATKDAMESRPAKDFKLQL